MISASQGDPENTSIALLYLLGVVIYKYNKKEREMVIYFLKNYSSVICFTLICCFRKVEADSENFSSASVV